MLPKKERMCNFISGGKESIFKKLLVFELPIGWFCWMSEPKKRKCSEQEKSFVELDATNPKEQSEWEQKHGKTLDKEFWKLRDEVDR